MRARKRKIDAVSIERANSNAKELIQRALRYINDPDKQDRLSKQECIACYYSQRVGGASMTQCECGICSTEQMFGSTAVDVIFKDCAVKNQLCKHCGSDIELKNRRKPRAFQENDL